jgi:hypothetical protein
MPSDAIDFWVQHSVHARSELGVGGSSQSAETLAERLLNAAQERGLTTEDVTREIGDSAEYLKAKLDALNATEAGRLRQKE